MRKDSFNKKVKEMQEVFDKAEIRTIKDIESRAGQSYLTSENNCVSFENSNSEKGIEGCAVSLKTDIVSTPVLIRFDYRFNKTYFTLRHLHNVEGYSYQYKDVLNNKVQVKVLDSASVSVAKSELSRLSCLDSLVLV